ncbi:AAA family ATPase [Catellatospora sp. NPDC049609]|uniref:AAA family ATPase n=1 Tax=Catellatospora sp. NPDC049609 TaxID=3155505 RepID=UPI003435360C
MLDTDQAAPPDWRARSLATVTPERISWLWPGYLAAGKLHVIDGDPGLGKSTMTLDVAARVSTGGRWPDDQPGCEPAGVLLLSAEDGLADTIRPRLDAAGADVEKVFAFTCWDIGRDGERTERPATLPGDTARLAKAIASNRVGLVVIDPLMAFLGGGLDAHRDQDVRRALSLLARVAEATNAAVVLVRHLNKASGSSALYRGGGSIGIIGAARLAFAVGRDPDDEEHRVMAATKANITRPAPSLRWRIADTDTGHGRVVWEGESRYGADELLRAPADTEEREERDEASSFIHSYLADHGGEATASDVLKAGRAAGIPERTLRRARDRAGVVTRKAGMRGGWLWQLDLERDPA